MDEVWVNFGESLEVPSSADMKILYAIQGTGNGHIARAEDIVPVLKQFGTLDVLVSGAQVDLRLPYEVKYRSRGLSFYFGKTGGVNILKTITKNNVWRVYREIRHFPVEQYNLIVNDFEPITAWAARIKGIPSVALSHQSAVLSENAPQPDKQDWLGKMILKYYAPAHHHYGFHFRSYDEHIFTPVVRGAIRQAKVEEQGHITVYLPAYDDLRLLEIFRQFTKVQWQVFSKHAREEYKENNVHVWPIEGKRFTQSMATSSGVLCGAGFETPAEALYLGKKLLVVPMKNQFEQHCNAAALKEMGVPVLPHLSKNQKQVLEEWLNDQQTVSVNYEDQTLQIIEKLMNDLSLEDTNALDSIKK